jgi:uncharacterized protein
MNHMQGNYRVVFQLTNQEVAIHKNMIRHINNLLIALPGTLVQVVVHADGLSFALNHSPVKNITESLVHQGLEFLICENTLKARNISANEVLPFFTKIPSGIAHIVVKQSEGWSYIKAG